MDATSDRISKLLVVADVWCQVEGICGHVREHLGDEGTEVLVIAPPLVSSLHTLASDVDKETGRARLRLADVLACLEMHGIPARGSIGDDDPLLAIDDALAEFPAEKIVLVTDTLENESRREHHLPAYLEKLGLPSVHVIVPHDSDTPSYE